MYNKEARSKAEAILKPLTWDIKDAIYRILWARYVKEDVEACLEDGEYSEYDEYDTSEVPEKVAERYSFEGDYDCNLSYWENLENLIKEELGKLDPPDEPTELTDYEIRCIKADEFYDNYKVGDI